MTQLTEKRRDLLYGLLVAAIVFLIYANSLGNGFVWDDTNVIVNNPVLRGSPIPLFIICCSTARSRVW